MDLAGEAQQVERFGFIREGVQSRRPGLTTKQEKMTPVRTAFGCAVSGSSGFSTFWLLVFAITILDDAQRQEKKRRSTKRSAAQAAVAPQAGAVGRALRLPTAAAERFAETAAASPPPPVLNRHWRVITRLMIFFVF